MSEKQEYYDKVETNFFDKFVIPIECGWKDEFDNIMLLASCVNVFSQGYYSAFGNPTTMDSKIVEWVTECLFSLDLLFCFLQEYNDTETYRTVREVKTIAKNYLKGSFIFDLIAIVPFNLFLNVSNI